MEAKNQGVGQNLARHKSIRAASTGNSVPGLIEEDEEELKLELTKVEDEIQTLRQVLLAKEKHAVEIKRQLGLGPLDDLKQNLTRGLKEVQTSNVYLTASATLEDISRSDVYKRTQETLSQAGQVTTAAISSVGVAITQRLGGIRALPFSGTSSGYSMRNSISMPAMRNSSTFKSFQDKMGSIKCKMSRSMGSSDGLNSAGDRSLSF